MFFVKWFEILIVIKVNQKNVLGCQNIFSQLKMLKIAGWALISS
jgi:hypothetical protein